MYLPLLENLQRLDTYSWEASSSAWLYRQLCISAVMDNKDLLDPLIPITIWARDQLRLFWHQSDGICLN